MLPDRGGGEGFGLGPGQVEQLKVDCVGLPGQVGCVDALDPSSYVREASFIRDFRCLQVLPLGGRLIVGAFAAAICDGGGVADRFIVGVKKFRGSEASRHSRMSSSRSLE